MYAYPFVVTCALGEGGVDADAWRREYGGTLYTGALDVVFNSANPLWPGKVGPAGTSHALGITQFQPATYQEVAARTGLATLAPQSQIANTWNHMQVVYNRVTKGSLPVVLMMGDWPSAASALKTTWTSFTSTKLGDRYASAVKQLTAAIPSMPAPPIPDPQAPSVDPELTAIADMLKDLAGLDMAAQKRAVAYVTARLNIT